MSKKVLIITTSLRTGSNSEILAKEFEKGAREVGHDVKIVSLKGKEMRFCIGCLSCQKTGSCILRDDVFDILEKIKNAEVIVFATPLYYYGISGQMKTLLDRLNPLFSCEYAFRDIYMIVTAAENEQSTFEKAYASLKGWVDCFDKANLKGIITGGGMNEPNEAENNDDVKKKAYELGRGL